MIQRALLQAVVNADRIVTIALNGLVRWKLIRSFFAAISWLGDGRIWYATMLMLPLLRGEEGIRAAMHMAFTGLITLGIYKSVKGATQRPRPAAVYEAVEQGTRALDEYSFPSGHTMHAVVFTTIVCEWYPSSFPIFGVFTLLTGISRVVLGLHYPTDVVLGAVFGLIISYFSLSIVF